jgi:hypothetical protein
MSNKNTVFYRGNTAISVDFSAEEISSDGSLILLEKLERKHKLIGHFSKFIPDIRDPFRTVHSREKQLKQRVYSLIQGYEDTNDVKYLINDPLYKDILEGDMASQPTLSRFENCMGKASIIAMCYAWVDRYVQTLSNRKRIIIDIDSMDTTDISCTTSCFFTTGKPGKLLYLYCVLATAIQTNGMWLF